MLTPDAAGWLAEALKGARLVVANGSEETAMAIAAEPVVEDGRITLTARFGPDDANFEWSERRVMIGDRVIDVERVDLGRKAEGATWTLETELEIPEGGS
jgi:hypothetical protein